MRNIWATTLCAGVGEFLLLLNVADTDELLSTHVSALTLHAASGKFAPFFVFRVLLGLFESVVSPVLIALVACFYAKNEQSKRIGAFYAMSESHSRFPLSESH